MSKLTPTDLLSLVVYRDSEVIILNKPEGVVSAGPATLCRGVLRESVESLLIQGLKRQVWAVHQLDLMTSGLNVFALKVSAVHPWSERLKLPHTKHYLALCHTQPASPQTIEIPLGMRIDKATQKRFPAIDLKEGKPSKTYVIRSLSNPDGSASWVEVELATGRQHQVRLHLGHVGHPLLGEPLHRDPPCQRHHRHALHAHHLAFSAFEGRPAFSVKAPLPADLKQLAQSLGLPEQPWGMP